jgi:hypothetical protein
MINLKQPQRGDNVKADLIRDMITAIRENNVTAGTGLAEEQTPHGKIIRLKQQLPASKASVSSVYPRAFDIKSIAAGVITLTRCHFQIQSVYLTLATEPTVTIATGVVCAVYNTSTGAITPRRWAWWGGSPAWPSRRFPSGCSTAGRGS